jgi:predicted dehydrogenase
MKKFKVGVIGCGFIANGKHLYAMTQRDDVEVVAFCDLIPERAQASAKRFGTPDALVCQDYREVVTREDIDVIFVCTPNSSHAEISIAALSNGKHVMCEKPMAKTSAEAKAMVDAAKASGMKLSIGYQNRFREDTLLLKSLCDNGELGDIYYAKALALRRRGVPTWGVFMDKEKQGGGPLIDLATHALDMALWMMQNYEPEMVLGTTFDKIGKIGSPANGMGPWDPAEYEVEDAAFGLVRFKNGATVIVESSWALNQLTTNEAMVMLSGTKAGADMYPPEGPQHHTPGLHVRINGEQGGKLYAQSYEAGDGLYDKSGKREQFAGSLKETNAWFDSIRDETELVVKPEQALVVTQILEAIYQSAASGEAIRLG